MKDGDVDRLLRQHLSGDQPREGFRQETLSDLTAEFVRTRRRRSALRSAELAAAAVLVAGIAFLGGRMSVPRELPPDVEPAPLVTAEPGSVSVPSDLVAWLDAAHLFRHLGMEDRMVRAVERASRLLPGDALIAEDHNLVVFAAASLGNGKGPVEPMGISGPHPSAESVNQILAQSLGD